MVITVGMFRLDRPTRSVGAVNRYKPFPEYLYAAK